ncbi:TraX family protein [Aerococcus vaginalis]
MSGFALKLIALIFMAIDHINTFLGHPLGLPLWFSWLGRFVAPLFLYLLMEGFIHTSNRKRYLLRLFTVAMIMHGINIARNLLTGNYVNPVTGETGLFELINGLNIFWTLFLIFALFILLTKVKEQSKWFILPSLLLTPLILMAEGGFYLLPIALASFYFKNDAKKVSLFIAGWSAVLLAKALFNHFSGAAGDISLYQTLTFDNEFMMATVIPFLLSYNGQRGGYGKPWEKQLFYIFYPTHLIVLYTLAYFFG